VINYTFYQTKHWELTMPLQIGVGDAYYQYQLNGVKTKTDENINFIYEPTISVNYKIIKWIGIEADLGYRFIVTQNKRLNQQLNAPIFALGISIYYSEIFKSVFPNSKLAKMM
jgi:hypothetical protein